MKIYLLEDLEVSFIYIIQGRRYHYYDEHAESFDEMTNPIPVKIVLC